MYTVILLSEYEPKTIKDFKTQAEDLFRNTRKSHSAPIPYQLAVPNQNIPSANVLVCFHQFLNQFLKWIQVNWI